MSLTQKEKSDIERYLKTSGISPNESISKADTASGGCISKAVIATMSDGKELFIKYSGSSSDKEMQCNRDMFFSEMEGLRALRQTDTFRVPEPLGSGQVSDNGVVLVTEKISLNSVKDHRRFGTCLAKMHLYKGPSKFGFHIDNFIGSTPQQNTWSDDWVQFLHKRLKFQFDSAQFTGSLRAASQELLDRLPRFFEGAEITPSLIHGDLWFGNCAEDEHGMPVIFDPAAYWGHSEAELGIMRLFGGFKSELFEAYHELIPRAPGFKKRGYIYELYHVVNHYNLFGSGYLGQCQQLLERILD
ncbi:hypothetical protein H4R99_006516 [Coemansia sp. RSA 1722]|nr:hypothetical protein H4R99_006516 [Coemansia sp. RSA 1722]